MEISPTADGKVATVRLNDGDYLSVGYVDAKGVPHILNITAAHLVLSVQHEKTGAGILFRPSVPLGYQFTRE